jgi:hypothetical protein
MPNTNYFILCYKTTPKFVSALEDLMFNGRVVSLYIVGIATAALFSFHCDSSNPSDDGDSHCLSDNSDAAANHIMRFIGGRIDTGANVATNVGNFYRVCDTVMYTCSLYYVSSSVDSLHPLVRSCTRAVDVSLIKSGTILYLAASDTEGLALYDTVQDWFTTFNLSDTNICLPNVEGKLVDTVNAILQKSINPRFASLAYSYSGLSASCDTMTFAGTIADSTRYFVFHFDVLATKSGNALTATFSNTDGDFARMSESEWYNKLDQ